MRYAFLILLVLSGFYPLYSQTPTINPLSTPPTPLQNPQTNTAPVQNMTTQNPNSTTPAQPSLQELQQRVFSLQGQLNDLNVYLSNLQVQLNNIINNSTDPQEKKRLLVNDLQKRLMDTDTKLKAVREDLSILDAEIKKMQAEQVESASDTSAISKTLDDLDKRVSRVESDVQKILGTDRNPNIESMDSTHKDIGNNLGSEIRSGDVIISSDQNTVKIRLDSDILFQEGEVSLSKTGQETLQKIAPTLKNLKDKMVVVVGHADTKPIGPNLSDFYPTNWELSTTRGSIVVRYLEDLGVDPSTLVAAGRSFYVPDPNGGNNRRVEIWVFPKLFSQTAPAS